MRQMVCDVLKSYDREHATAWFRRLEPSHVTAHENQLLNWLASYDLPEAEVPRIHQWFLDRRWEKQSIVAMHAPFQGVIEVLRWFQLQPLTEVALLTGRPEALREDTLRCLEVLGAPHRVCFDSNLLFMNPEGWEKNVSSNKARGISLLKEQGKIPFAFIDNEPANLKSIASLDPDGEILLLHADTIFESKRSFAPPGTVVGRDYRLDKLVDRVSELPNRVQLVWHGANTPHDFERALLARVQWVEIDVRSEATVHRPIVRSRALHEAPWSQGEEPFLLRQALEMAASGSKGIKLDIKGDAELLTRVIDEVNAFFPQRRLWFNARLEDAGRQGFARLRDAFPNAILQCPADWLVPFIFADPKTATNLAEQIRSWGIDRFSFVWDPKRMGVVLDFMEKRGHETNLYRVPDLEGFLHAAMLLPTSITTDFEVARRLL